MPDMLVKLYQLPDISARVADLRTRRIEVRRAQPGDGPLLQTWVRQHFAEGWGDSIPVALAQRPITCFLAVEHQVRSEPPRQPYDLPAERLVGFALYDVSSRGMFGPTGVHPAYRGRGIGAAVLVATLRAMADEGYMYAVIGWVGPAEFYARTVGATLIPDSEPAGFRGPLRGD
jgi:GNAT superfamily N-acetyltransferase